MAGRKTFNAPVFKKLLQSAHLGSFARALNTFKCDEHGIEIDIEVLLILGAVVAAFVARRLGYTYNEMQAGINEAIHKSMTALLIVNVVGSFRKPNAIRFGLGALYLSYEEIWDAVDRLREILETESWRDPKFQKVSV